MLIPREFYSLKFRSEYYFIRSWKKSSIYSGEKKLEAVLLVPDLKNMVKWTLVLIYGRLYIPAYSQGKIIFESQIRMVFNEVLVKDLRIPFFQVSEEKWVTSGFGLKVMLGGSLFVSGSCTMQLSCETRSNIV